MSIRRRARWSGCVLLGVALAAAQGTVARGGLLPVYANPVTAGVVDTFADPAVIRAKDGFWYAYGTTDAVRQSAGDDALHYLPVLRSEDLVSWTYVGDVFAAGKRPSWHPPDSLLWAADIRYVDGSYRLYYSLARGPRGPGGLYTVGVATAPTPLGPWSDSGGEVIRRGACPTEADIDPAMFTSDDGARYLYWGSFEHLCVSELDATATRAVGPVTKVHAGFAEGAFVVRHGGFHYLFVSESTCCEGAFSGYQVKVGRSRDPRGPFLDREGVHLTAPHTKGSFVAAATGNAWAGPGHPTVVTDLAGQDWLVYHAHDRTQPLLTTPPGAPRRPLLVDRLDWVHGWPVLRGGRGPSNGLQAAPVTRSNVGDDFNNPSASGQLWRREGEADDRWSAAQDLDAGGYLRHTGAPTTSYLVSTLPAPLRVRAEADLRLPGADGAVGIVAAYRSPRDHVVAWLDVSRRALVTDAVVRGRSAAEQITPLPANFRFDTWHTVSLEIDHGRIHAQVTDSRLGDPLAMQDRALPAGAGGPGAVGAATKGGPAHLDNLGAAPLHAPVTAEAPHPPVGTPDADYGDEFDDGVTPGTAGDPHPWTWLRAGVRSESGGSLHWPTGGGELYGPGGDAAVLIRPAPPGSYTLETKLTFSGDGAPFQQAGLVLYGGDDEYVKLVRVATRGGETARTEFAKEALGGDGRARYGANFVGPPAHTTWLRLSHRLDPFSGEHEVRAATSRDGRTWVWGATWTLPPAADLRIGLIAQNSPGARATFHHVRVYRP